MDSNQNSGIFSGKLPGDVNKLEIINVKKFLQSRHQEIDEMFEMLKKNDKQERVFQKLPFVMRRRAMSHNPFKIPKNIRLHILREMAKNAPKASKRIKKNKRKRLNRLEEYQQRYKKNKWLETHLYHAKRFKMDSVWGYRLALTPTQKSKRRFLRYLKQRCVIHDRSYLEVLSVSGEMQDLKNGFKHVFSDYYLMFQKVYTSGNLRGSCFCYSRRNEPSVDINNDRMDVDVQNCDKKFELNDEYDLIGPVNYLWVPKKESEERRTIWLFVHPVSILQLLSILSQNKDLQVEKVNNLVKFELFGPFSLMSLKSVLKVDSKYSESNRVWHSLDYNRFNISNSLTLPLFISVPKVHGNCKLSSWLPNKLNESTETANLEPDQSKLSSERLQFYEYKSTPAQVNVNNLLRNRRRKDYSKLVAKLLESLSNNSNQSADKVKQDEDTSDIGETKIPILVIFRNTQPFGIDILMPSNSNASQLWILLNRNGCLSFGLHERQLMMNHYQVCSFPEDFPETELGQRYYNDLLRNEMVKYILRPANKRVNYSFLGVNNPFVLPVNLNEQILNFTLDIEELKNFKTSQGSLFKSRHLLLSSLCSGLYHFPSNDDFKVLRLTNFPYNKHNVFVQKLLGQTLDLLSKNRENQCKGTPETGINLGLGYDYYVVVKLSSFKGALNLLSRLHRTELNDLKTIPLEDLKRILNRNFTLTSYMRIKEAFHDEFKMSNLKAILHTKNSKILDQALVQKVLGEINMKGIKNSREMIGFVTSKGSYTNVHVYSDTVSSGVGLVKLEALLETVYNTLSVLEGEITHISTNF
ncbi:ribonuclease P [Theileria orientalis]|uniref:Ribonuclease P n=1 Tax=Theileria orientalis TaxID=68886 RepID=A0A976XJ33_THEOR|nr:ribonuclease P [Theileria orientalis]